MKIYAWVPSSMMVVLLAASSALSRANDEAAAPILGLPPGMARADNPQQVAALYSERHQQRVDAIRSAPPSDRLTPQEAYTQRLIAYRTQLVEEQHQRKMKELELEREREARRRAEEETLKADLEREREASIRRHQAIHVYHQWLERQRWQQWRLCHTSHQAQASDVCSEQSR